MSKQIMIHEDCNCVYLVQDIYGLSKYQKYKAIETFITTETKTLERFVNRLLKAIFKKHGIIVVDNNKSVLKSQLDTLKAKGIDIDLYDLYQKDTYYRCEYLGTSNNYFRVFIEDDRYLQCGIEIIERKTHGREQNELSML